jgi:hypothetical protein
VSGVLEFNDLKMITLPVVEPARGSLVIGTASHIVAKRRTIWVTVHGLRVTVVQKRNSLEAAPE